MIIMTNMSQPVYFQELHEYSKNEIFDKFNECVKTNSEELNEYGISHINISPIDTFKDNNYFSHRASYLNQRKPGENIVGLPGVSKSFVLVT